MDTRGTLERTYLTIEELASYLAFSTSQIYKMVEAGRIPFARVPGTRLIRFPKKEIDDWMRRNIVKPIS